MKVDTRDIVPRVCHNCKFSSEIVRRTESDGKFRFSSIPEWLYCLKEHRPMKFIEATCCPNYQEEENE